jgi:ATP-binding cassette, subfamily B, bacterial
VGGPMLGGFKRDQEAIAGRRLERRLVRRILGWTGPYRRRLVLFALTVVGVAAASTGQPLLFKALIDDAIPHRDTSLVTWLALGALGLAIAEGALRLGQRWLSATIGEGLIRDLRVALYDHVQRLPVGFFTRNRTGSLTSRLTTDVVGAQRAVTTTLGALTQNTFQVLFTIPVMLALEWRLTLVMLAVVPGFVLLARHIGRRLQGLTREGMEQSASMSATMTERFNVSGALLVHLFGDPRRERDAFADRADAVRAVGVRSAVTNQILVVGLTLVITLGTVVVFWLGGRLAAEGTITPGVVVAFSVYVSRVYQPLIQLTNARVELLTSMVAFERVFEVLDIEPSIADRPGAVELGRPVGRIELRDVSFTYPEEPSLDGAPATDDDAGEAEDAGDDDGDAGDAEITGDDDGDAEAVALRPAVLHDVAFTIEPGRTVALVGPSGAGKTTIAGLVCRLYDATSGQVLVDGHDVRDVTIASLRRGIAVVGQDPHLFHDTIRANLLYADPAASPERLEDACRHARIWDLVTSLPEGLDTVVGERGYRLSGGEKQRLAIARALLKDPAIVILDEATSHLDSDNEALIQAALHDVLAGRTSLVIAHRLSTIVGADEIVVLDGGRVVERGAHAQLVARDGLYAQLVRSAERATPTGEVPQPAWEPVTATPSAG